MTDITVTSTASYTAEDRSWLLSQWGQGPGENPSCVIDFTTFTAETHYPKGYLPSGMKLGVITAQSTGGKTVVGLYDNTATDGRETCAGLLHSSIKAPASTATKPGGALVVAGMVRESRLPIAIDAPGKADLKLVHFSA